MPIAIAFWVIFVIWLLFRGVGWRNPQWQYGWGGDILLVIMLFLIGCEVFGFILQGGGTTHFH